MYWDIVAVQPKEHHSLWIRFSDGATGLVKLDPDKLTGVLAPLCDPSFFQQVSIDHGAVSWPGEIDLAPDALYREIQASR